MEWCAALSPWATLMVHRNPRTRPKQPDAYMFHANARKQHTPRQPMRYAQPGELPPSRRAPGEPDDFIERFDAYTQGLLRR